MAVESAYVWLVVVGAFGAFGFGWGTGANVSSANCLSANTACER